MWDSTGKQAADRIVAAIEGDLGHHGPKARDRKIKPPAVISGSELKAKQGHIVLEPKGQPRQGKPEPTERQLARAAYMREYMAKKRAADRAAKEGAK